MSIQPSRTVSALCAGASKAFENLLLKVKKHPDTSQELSTSMIQDEFGRFHVWAANLGASQHPDSASSLDSRLREAPQILDQVIKILDRLISSVEKGMSIPGILKSALMNYSGIDSCWPIA